MGSCRTALLLVAVLAARPVAAASGGVRLDYQRGEDGADCPGEDEVRVAVQEQLGYDPFGDGPPTVETTFAREDDQLTARVELRDEEGVSMGARTLSGDSCAELAPAVELVLALAVASLHARLAPPGATPPPNSTPPPSPPPTPSSSPSRLPPPALPSPRGGGEPSRQPASVGFDLGAGIGAALDAAPAPAFAFTLQLALTRPRWSVGLEMRGDLPAGADAAFQGRVETALIIGMVVPCLRHRVAAVCALAAFGAERGDGGEGANYTNPRSATAFYAALGGRLAVEPSLARSAALRLYADLLAPLTRTELYAGSIGDLGHRLYRTPAVSSVLGLTFLTHFP